MKQSEDGSWTITRGWETGDQQASQKAFNQPEVTNMVVAAPSLDYNYGNSITSQKSGKPFQVGNGIKIGFSILFIIWITQFFLEVQIMSTNSDSDSNWSDEDCASTNFEFAEECMQEMNTNNQLFGVLMTLIEIVAWGMICFDLLVIAKRANNSA